MKKLNIMVILIIVVVNLILSFLLWLFIPKMITPKNISTEDSLRTDAEKDTTKDSLSVDSGIVDNSQSKDYFNEYAIYNWEDIIVNPSNSSERFLMVSLGFEYKLEDEKLPDELKNKTILITDNLNTYFSSQKIEDLVINDFRNKMKVDIIKIVNSQLSEGKITRVFFAQYVIQ